MTTRRDTYWLNYFRPSVYIKTFTDLNVSLLRTSGIRLLICDLDNTLSPHFTRFPNRKVIAFCQKVQDNGIKLAIVSNNSKKRVSTYVEKLHPDAVVANAKKPMKRRILRLIQSFNLLPNETIVMGDQFITDIWLANRIGSKSVLVLPMIDSSSDTSSSWITRFLDRFIYKKLEHGNYLQFDYEREGVLDDEYQII